MRCPSCKSTLKLGPVTKNKAGTETTRKYRCGSCGTQVETKETVSAVNRPAPDHRAPARSWPKRAPIHQEPPDPADLASPLDTHLYRGE